MDAGVELEVGSRKSCSATPMRLPLCCRSAQVWAVARKDTRIRLCDCITHIRHCKRTYKCRAQTLLHRLRRIIIEISGGPEPVGDPNQTAEVARLHAATMVDS